MKPPSPSALKKKRVDIDHKWMKAYAYKIKTCPKCKRKSFCLIMETEKFGEEWECANGPCSWNPKCVCPNCLKLRKRGER